MKLFRIFIGIFILLNSWNSFSNSEIPVKDTRYASVTCSPIKDKKEISCDYRFSTSLDVINLSAKLGKQPIQISKELIAPYPSQEQITSLLFLVDSSDPSRKNTIERRIVGDIFEMLTALDADKKSQVKVGLATFDTTLKIISPIGEDHSNSLNALSKIKAEGQATEFYKNIIDAISLLSKTESARKGLVIFSDGKDEDRAYKKEDVLKVAKEANVVILGLGYSERPADNPYLQTLKRLADETHGQFFNATDKKSIDLVLKNPLFFIDRGGKVILNTSNFHGKQQVTFDLGLKDGKVVEVTTEVQIPDSRNLFEQIIDFVVDYWLFVLIGLIAIAFFIFFISKVIQRKNLIKAQYVEYAYLSEPDGSGSKYVINKTAIRIGRGKDNDLCLSNDSISLHHAELHRRRDGTFYIVDLGSTNGIFVNSKKISQSELMNGDEVELGEVRLNFLIK
jgi:uncharacterized protein YjgD (DUF1641 family)